MDKYARSERLSRLEVHAGPRADRGVAHGELRPDLNPAQEAEYFYAQIQGSILLS